MGQAQFSRVLHTSTHLILTTTLGIIIIPISQMRKQAEELNNLPEVTQSVTAAMILLLL